MSGSTITMRELLFCPGPWMDWFESVAKSRPPWRPCSKAMSIAGPAGWKPPPAAVGLPRGPRSSSPFWSNTRMSGVKGLFFANVPPGKLPCSLHWLGNPCPDSSTNTWKLLALPRKAIPVGPFRPDLNTDTVKPFGTTMSCPLLGLKCTISVGQSGLVTSALTGEGYSGTTSTIATRKASADTRIAVRIARTLMEEPPAVSDQGETWKGSGRARLAVCRACRREWDRGAANWQSPDLGPRKTGRQSESCFHHSQPHCCPDSAFQTLGGVCFPDARGLSRGK